MIFTPILCYPIKKDGFIPVVKDKTASSLSSQLFI